MIFKFMCKFQKQYIKPFLVAMIAAIPRLRVGPGASRQAAGPPDRVGLPVQLSGVWARIRVRARVVPSQPVRPA